MTLKRARHVTRRPGASPLPCESRSIETGPDLPSAPSDEANESSSPTFSHFETLCQLGGLNGSPPEVVGVVDYQPRPLVLVEAGVAVTALLPRVPVLADLPVPVGPRTPQLPYLPESGRQLKSSSSRCRPAVGFSPRIPPSLNCLLDERLNPPLGGERPKNGFSPLDASRAAETRRFIICVGQVGVALEPEALQGFVVEHL